MRSVIWIRIFRIMASMVSLFGLGLLIRTLFQVFTGEIVEDYNYQHEGKMKQTLWLLLLYLPIPLHVISIGLIVQKKWLTKPLKKIAWYMIVISGVWLGVSIVLKAF